jgi:3-hydroxyisobutyrate dehydrogenase-like beta-hydroxyacid dehydrogenase
MARRLVEAGYPVVLWARRPETLEAFAGTSAEIASSIAELGLRAEHVGVCVVDDDGVQQVCGELIPAMRPGGRIAIHSTVHPRLCQELAAHAAAQGLSLIDAPVSGGGGAAAGTLTVMVGGDKQAVEAADPIFRTFASLVVHLGGVGAGQTAKLLNNALMAAHTALAHHALAAGSALGIDRGALIELVKASSGRSYGFEVYARLPSPAAFAHGARLLAKDLRLLGETLQGDGSYAAFRDLAMPVLEQILNQSPG